MKYRSAFPGLLLVFLPLLAACAAPAPPEPRPYREAAGEAAAWIRSTASEAEYGTAWPDDALRPGEVGTSLSGGVAGTVLFFLALHQADPQGNALADARRGADYLLAALPEALAAADTLARSTSFYGGFPGVGYALFEAFKATGDERYRAGALHCVEKLHALAEPRDAGVRWNDFNDVLNGTAGAGLFLLYAAREMGREASRGLAVRAGHYLLGQSLEEPEGLTWKAGARMDFILPNFSHGAAGIGYFMATLYRDTGEPAFLEAAQRTAAYLHAIARTDGDVFLVPYGVPNEGYIRPFDVGWAHGPAGTARFFYRLWQATGEAAHRETVDAAAQGILASGLPGPPRVGFGEEPFKPDLRFGMASVALFFLDLYRASGDAAHLQYARRLTDDLLERATRDAAGLRWAFPRYDFVPHPGEPSAYTGYFYGAAGYGLLLLRLDAALHDAPWTLRLPDDPFDE